MNKKSVFHLISDVTKKEGVSCILIGGFAVNYYRVTRQTADVDFLITKDAFDKIIALLEKAGYKNGLTQTNFAQLKSTQISLLVHCQSSFCIIRHCEKPLDFIQVTKQSPKYERLLCPQKRGSQRRLVQVFS